MGPFNNREIATAFWVIVFLAFSLRKADIRKSFAAVLRAFCQFKILLSVFLMVLYTVAVVRLLAAIGLWKVSLLKDTIVWFCVNAMAMMIRFVTSDDAENIFQKVLTDSFKIVIVLEFLVNTYTFSFPTELVLVPILTLIAMVDVIASSDEKYSAVAKITKWVQMVISFVILAIVVNRAISNFQTLLSLDTFRSIALAPLLSLLFTPFLYVMVLISKYELVFLRLNFGLEKERGLKRYARRRILIYAGLSLRKLQHLLRNHAGDLMHIQTKADVDRLVQRRVNP
ncbi:hypothetical protein MHLNE_11110 [Moorella humiferrea]|uniref:hypothetical protein n=1 Tax=Neomoorella humiferrea TaxID=676965 RepID=UPI0030D142F6